MVVFPIKKWPHLLFFYFCFPISILLIFFQPRFPRTASIDLIIFFYSFIPFFRLFFPFWRVPWLSCLLFPFQIKKIKKNSTHFERETKNTRKLTKMMKIAKECCVFFVCFCLSICLHLYGLAQRCKNSIYKVFTSIHKVLRTHCS